MKDFYKPFKGILKQIQQKQEKKRLEDWFNKLFGEETSYYALNRIQGKTLSVEEIPPLLVVLEHPWIPCTQ